MLVRPVGLEPTTLGLEVLRWSRKVGEYAWPGEVVALCSAVFLRVPCNHGCNHREGLRIHSWEEFVSPGIDYGK